jgi:mono/diheme cytochrome c family protein
VTRRAPRLTLPLALAVVLGLAGPAGTAPETVTWSNQIARLVQRECQACHRTGEIAPFPLVTYGDAARQARKIQRMVERRMMPPWKPVPGVAEFIGARRLSDADIALVREWVEAGAPEGDPRDLPPPRVFPSTWTRGTPDVVLAPIAAYDVPASDRDLYRCFVIRTSFPEDRYVSTVEFLPGNRRIVHHVLTYIDTSGTADRLAGSDPALGYDCFGGPGFVPSASGLGGWAPGAPPHVNPEGVGYYLPAGARVVTQVHYHNRGQGADTDLTRVGLTFARAAVDKRARALAVVNRTFVIPAGAARHEVRAVYTVPPSRNFHVLGIAPHMHLLGREMKVTAVYPDGTAVSLIQIDDWDFHWQGTYTFARPIPLPGGTRVELVATFDNSAANRRNPNSPPRDVAWGEQTTDEMCIAFLRVTLDSERLNHVPQYGAPGDSVSSSR